MALKVIHAEWVRKQEAIDRFRREVKTAASLDHPNIVTAHDAEQAGDLHFLVMEHVDGVDLAQTVQKSGQLSVEQACEYIRQAATGLQYAHDRGMVHRDIKPHNLMVTNDNVVKILDFGLASLAPQTSPGAPISEDADGNLTIAGSVMGTPDYISPEQAEDARSVDGRSDIYSLGMTLYFLLAGRRPFETGSAMDKLKQHAEAEPTPLSELRDDLPRELLDVVARMTAKDPADRFQSPQEIAAALQPLVHQADSGSVPSFPSQDSDAWGGRSRSILSWGMLTVMALVAGWVWLSGVLPNGGTVQPDEVHGPLSDLDSYIAAMMQSPHDLVFLNMGDISPDKNYFCFKPTPKGIHVRFPAYEDSVLGGSRQGKYVNRLKEFAESMSLTVNENGAVEENGAVRGINYSFDVEGDQATVTNIIQTLIRRTLSVKASEECRYTFQNLPSESSGKIGAGPTYVSGDDFIRQYSAGKSAYLGEQENRIFLVPRERRAEKQLRANKDVLIANVNELPPDFARDLRSGKVKHRPDLVNQLRGAHGTEVAEIAKAICEAASIPNDQWRVFATSKNGSFESIQGEPLSLVLLKNSDSSVDSAISNEFRMNPGKPGQHPPVKPSELSAAMALSASRGYYSLLQPQYLTDLTYNVEIADPNSAKITGRVCFNGLDLYAGKVKFTANVDHELNIQVTEFTLPEQGITVRKNDDGQWATRKIDQVSEDVFAADYDFSHVPARAAEVHGFSPRQLAADKRYGKLLSKLGLTPFAMAMTFDKQLEQVLWVKLPQDDRESYTAILSVGVGDAIEFAAEKFGRESLAENGALPVWTELQGRIKDTERMSFLVLDKGTLAIGTRQGLELHQELWKQPRDGEFLATAAPLNKDHHQFFSIAKPIDQHAMGMIAGTTTNSPQLSFLMDHLPIATDCSSFAVTLSLNEKPELQLTSRFANEDTQAEVTPVMKSLATSLSELAKSLPTNKQRFGRDNSIQLTPMAKAVLTSALEGASITEPSELEARMTISLADIEPQLRPYIEEALNKISSKEELYDVYSENSLRMIAMAFHSFHAVHGFFPSVKTMLPGAKHPVSWRVAILPYIEGQEIYDQYDFDEPWDSEANKKFLSQMPAAYRHPSQKKGASQTSYVTIAGPNTATGDGTKPIDYSGLKDGTPNTMILAETVAGIPWTKPEDPKFDPKMPLRTLGGIYGKGFQVALADGSVLFIPAGISDETLNALITRNGGEQIDIANLMSTTGK